MQIGYARVSTTDQDLTAQRDALLRLGVEDTHIYVDHGMTGANRARPGLREALAAVRSGDTLVVTKLDRLARSLRDARDIADELTAKGVALSLGGSRYDPTDPIGRLLFNVLGMVAEFERDLISMHTREGMAVARAQGRLKGKQPKLSKAQRSLLFELHDGASTPRRKLLNWSACLEPPSTVSFNAVGRCSWPQLRLTSSDASASPVREVDPHPCTAP
jgi:DNA invertase Pin-like site-specific DNA recombinase